jgi:nucleoside-diphosphate-sugar epimerase
LTHKQEEKLVRILITGGAGYIGSTVVQELSNKGHKLVVMDTFNWGRDALEPLSNVIRIIKGDCRNSKDLIYALEQVDAVIHLAGIVGDPACKINFKAHHTVNVEATRTLVNCCTDPNLDLIRDFIFLSSCSVYGNVNGLYDQVTEENKPNPLSLYAQAKLQSEQIILKRAQEIPYFHPTILRLTTVFGWSPRPRLDLVTNYFAYKAWKDRKLTIFGDGMQYRSLISVKDVARAIAQILDTPRFMRDGKIFHVGEERNNKTIKEIAEIAKSILPKTEIEIIIRLIAVGLKTS